MFLRFINIIITILDSHELFPKNLKIIQKAKFQISIHCDLKIDNNIVRFEATRIFLTWRLTVENSYKR